MTSVNAFIFRVKQPERKLLYPEDESSMIFKLLGPITPLHTVMTQMT